MVIQVKRFVSAQKCTRLCWSLTDPELVLAEKSKELGTHWRKGTSNSDWRNAGIWSCLAVFVQLSCYLQLVFPHCALAELTASPPLQMCPAVLTWHLTGVLVISQGLSVPVPAFTHPALSPCSYIHPILLSVPVPAFTPSCSQLSAGLGNPDKTWGLYSALSDANTCLG